MGNERFALAEFNISRLKAPLDSPLLQEFVAFLDPVNRFAEHSPGFLWRLTAPDGGASSYLPSPYADEMMIANLSVWHDIESLSAFTYHTAHSYFLRSRNKWFHRATSHQVVLWWIPREHRPTLTEAQAKLQALESSGPLPDAFTFQALFASDGIQMERAKPHVQP